jgi:hypothetical protein
LDNAKIIIASFIQSKYQKLKHNLEYTLKRN